MNETERTALGDQVRESKHYCTGKFPACWHTQISWSNRMISSIGNAKKGSPNIIKLSVPIIRAILGDHGLKKVLEAVDETVKHEFAHLAVKFADAPAHGQEWAANMRTLGLDPSDGQYHDYKCGRELFSDGALRAKFPLGHEVIFQHKDTWYRGYVHSHKTKRMHIWIETKLVSGQWEPIDGFTLTCPWSIVERDIHPIQEPK